MLALRHAPRSRRRVRPGRAGDPLPARPPRRRARGCGSCRLTTWRVLHAEQPPVARDAFQLGHASVDELEVRPGDEVLHRARNEYLARACLRRDARPNVDGNSRELASTGSHSPVWSPARTSRPTSETRATMAMAQRIARAGPSKLAKKPSPAVSNSLPRKRVSSRRTISWCSRRRSRHARSPIAAAWAVDPTMSVKRTVARTRSDSSPSSSTDDDWMSPRNRESSSTRHQRRRRPARGFDLRV